MLLVRAHNFPACQPSCPCAYCHTHRFIGVASLTPPLPFVFLFVPPIVLSLRLDAQAMLQMDTATKWGQEKGNSLVFNTFIFMQVPSSASKCMCPLAC